MSFKRTFLQFVFLLFFCFSFSCVATTSQAQEEEIYKHLRDQWHRVDYTKPLGFDTIFRNLDRPFWPALPESHEWRIEDDTAINLYKHKDAPDRNINFVTYFTNSLDQFNFLTQWDGATQHSFAYTRKDLKSEKLRKVYPVNFPGYMCGHCIDFLDTQGISEISICPGGRGSIIIESISTLDPRNYIPEPIKPTAYWGETARRDLVAQIRQEEGTYAQYMYYFFSPLRTTNGTAIPWGVYFVQTSPSLNSYNIIWPYPAFIDPIHSGSDGNWQQRLKVSSNFFPAPFVHDLSKKSSRELSTSFPFQHLKDITYEQLHELFTAADHEVKSVIGKATLIQYLILWHPNYRVIATWIERLIQHAEILHNIQEMRTNLHDVIRNLCTVITASGREVEINQESSDHQLITHLRNLLQENQLSTTRELTPARSSFRLKHAPSYPIVYIDGEKADTTGGETGLTVRTIIEMLKKTPPVHVRLINLSTARARNIWNLLVSETSVTESTSLKTRISCTVDPDKKYSNEYFANSALPSFSPPVPLLDPIEVNGSGNTQEVVTKIVETLEENRVAHLFLRNLPYQQNEFLVIINNLYAAFEVQERMNGILKRDDLHRLSNYSVDTKGYLGWIKDSFNRYGIFTAQIPPTFSQISRSCSVVISTPSTSFKSSSKYDSEDSVIDDLSTSFQEWSLDQIQKALPLLHQRALELTPSIEQKLSIRLDTKFEEVEDLSVTLQNDIIMMEKEYTVRDIANLIRCSFPTVYSSQFILGDDVLEGADHNTPPESIIYKLGTKYILPAYHPQSLILCLRTFFKALSTQESNDIIVPYNSGMHWVTLHIKVSDQITINYIDSLFHEHTDINDARNEEMHRSLTPLKTLLKKLFPQKEVKNPEAKLARLQKDSKACGPIVVENIKDIIQEATLPTFVQLSDVDVLNIRRIQNTQLESVGKRLDDDDFSRITRTSQREAKDTV